MEEERISLSQRERDRLKVLHEVQQGHLKQVEAAQRLRLTDRHIRRLLARLRREGDGGLVHRLRGRFSNRKIPPALQRTLRHCARPATPVSDVRWRRNIFASKDSARAERRLRSLVSFHPRACAVF